MLQHDSALELQVTVIIYSQVLVCGCGERGLWHEITFPFIFWNIGVEKSQKKVVYRPFLEVAPPELCGRKHIGPSIFWTFTADWETNCGGVYFRGLTTSCICWRLQIRLDAIHIMGHWIHDLQILIVAYVASGIELVLGGFFKRV